MILGKKYTPNLSFSARKWARYALIPQRLLATCRLARTAWVPAYHSQGVADEVSRLRYDDKIILERRKIWSNEINFLFSSVAEWLTPLGQKNDTASLTHQAAKDAVSGPIKVAIHRIRTQLSLKTHSRQTLKKSQGSVLEPHNTNDASLHTSDDEKSLDILDSRNFFFTNLLDDESVLYRTYRLEDVSHHHKPRGTCAKQKYIKRMALKLSDHHFSEKDTITVADFLTRFVWEANTQEISGAQALVALFSCIEEFAETQYYAGAEMMSPEKGGIYSWPEAVRYLLRSYCQSFRNSFAIVELHAVSRGPM